MSKEKMTVEEGVRILQGGYMKQIMHTWTNCDKEREALQTLISIATREAVGEEQIITILSGNKWSNREMFLQIGDKRILQLAHSLAKLQMRRVPSVEEILAGINKIKSNSFSGLITFEQIAQAIHNLLTGEEK